MDTTTTEMATAPTTKAKRAKPASKLARKAASKGVVQPLNNQPGKPAKLLTARALAAQAVASGVVPSPPDFSAQTHARFRKRLEEIVALVESGNIRALKALVINPVSSSPRAMAKYRDNAAIALTARAKAGEGLTC